LCRQDNSLHAHRCAAQVVQRFLSIFRVDHG
jgi:hypothetical protein